MHDCEVARDQEKRKQFRMLSRGELKDLQLRKLCALVDRVRVSNAFYRKLWDEVEVGEVSWEWFEKIPLITKDDLVNTSGERQSGNGEITERNVWSLGHHHTFATHCYSRAHRTSGTHGQPMVILDTKEDWQWWLDTWQFVLDAAEVNADDRVFLAFSFGPFIGFWSAFEACQQRGSLMIPGGGLSSIARLEMIRDSQATVVGCTPSYALHLAELAEQQRFDLAKWNVRVIIVAGEPGGSVPTTKKRIEEAWGAKVIDHAGATEIGPWGFATENGDGLHVIETEFIAEYLPRTEFGDGVSELVLTSLGRVGCPVIRYRTGDLVRPDFSEQPDRCQFVRLKGGILGRADDMLIVRGVNIFPSSLEKVIRGFPEIEEYRIVVFRQGNLDQIRVEVEGDGVDVDSVGKALQIAVGLRFDVNLLPNRSLPRFEGKGRRVIDERHL